MMICKQIVLSDFRNIEHAEVAFSDGVNILIGSNAQGKTNLLEAIFYASVGRSFRATHTNEMIRFGAPAADISLDYRDVKRDQNLHVKIFRDRRRLVEKNGMKMDRMSDVVGSFRAVLFCPEHLSLIKDGPAERRGYMDVAISRMYPMYMHALQKYHTLLKQRNTLLKQAVFDRRSFDATVELWSEQLANEAAVIAEARLKFIRRANRYLEACFAEMTGQSEKPTMVYDGSSGQDEDEYFDREATAKRYLELLMASHDREIAAGATLWGIHKDDLDIRLNGKSARIYASQGQQRSLALAMKLAEGEICREEFGDDPVFLFDDVLSELDASRRDFLIRRIKNKQVILTTCESEKLFSLNDARMIRVENGNYLEMSDL